MPSEKIPPERQALYYGGMVLTGIGVMLFISVFIMFMANFGNFDNFVGRMKVGGFCAIGGMVLVVIGQVMMSIGARGWAGSGVVLNPQKARKDIEPWRLMGGGVVQDALSEVEVVNKLADRLETSEPKIKVRCKNCQMLNDETAKFCNQCGSTI